MQNYPRCFKCVEPVESNPIFDAPCGHERCRSVVFHGICLMEWREHRDGQKKNLPQAFLVIVDHPEFGSS